MKALAWQIAATVVMTIAAASWLDLQPGSPEFIVVGLVIFGAVSGVTALVGRARSRSAPPQGDAHG